MDSYLRGDDPRPDAAARLVVYRLARIRATSFPAPVRGAQGQGGAWGGEHSGAQDEVGGVEMGRLEQFGVQLLQHVRRVRGDWGRAHSRRRDMRGLGPVVMAACDGRGVHEPRYALLVQCGGGEASCGSGEGGEEEES